MQIALAEVTAEWRPGIPENSIPRFHRDVWPRIVASDSGIDAVVIRHAGDARGWGALTGLLDFQKAWTSLPPPASLKPAAQRRLREVATFHASVFFKQDLQGAVRLARLWPCWSVGLTADLATGASVDSSVAASVTDLVATEGRGGLILTFMGEGETAMWLGPLPLLHSLQQEHEAERRSTP
jgi:hypothetical protein